jgi:hypothetical protein
MSHYITATLRRFSCIDHTDYPSIQSDSRYATKNSHEKTIAPQSVMSRLIGPIAIIVCGLLPLQTQAQIAFRGSSSAIAPAAGNITFRSVSSGVSGGITFRGSATTGITSLAPVYRSTASASAASGVLTLTIAIPGGTVENDVMVAAIGVSANAPTITAPDGWTLVRQLNNTNANANSLAIYIKVAAAFEPSSYSWTLSASTGAAGGIQTFYNVDTTTPIDTENGLTTPSGTTHATPSITTAVPNTMLVSAYTFSSSRAWNNPPLVPALPAVNIRVNVRSNANNNIGQSTATFQGVVAAAGVVPALTASTAVAGGSADVGNAHVLALRPALRVPRPVAIAPSDFMIAAIGVQPSTATLTPPAGWTLVDRINNAGPTSNALAIYRKFAVSGEPASYLWQVSGATAIVGGIQSFVGVDPTTPVDAKNGVATASSLTHTAPAITTVVANTMLVGHFTFASAATWTPPPASGGDAAMTETYDVASQAAGAAGQTLESTRVLHALVGATAAKTATASANADTGAAHLMALRPAGTQISLNTPAGVLENDVMVAAIGLTPSSVTITPPAGWTSIRRSNNPGGVTNSLEVFYKVASKSEPAGYTWTFSGNASAIGGIQAFVGVDTLAPINAENGQATPSALTHTAPSITTTVANTMLVSHHTFSSARTWTPPPASGGDAVMAESFDVLFPPAGAAGQSLEGNRVIHAAVGATAAKTATASNNADFGNTQILALKPLPANTIDLPLPSGTAAADVMIASIGFQPNTLVITPPAGWTLVNRFDNAAATANSLAVYQRVAGAAEPAAYEWVFSGGVLTAAAGGIQAFTGVDNTAPINASGGQTTGNSVNHATPSINTTVANTMLVTAHTFSSSATWTPPAGMTETIDRANLAVLNAAGQSIEANFMAQPAVGASGIKTAVASGSPDRGNTCILALRPTLPIPSKFNGCSDNSACPTLTARLNTRIANRPFALYLTTLNAGGTVQNLFNGNVNVSLVGTTAAGGALDANNCPTTALDLNQALGSLAFTGGLRTQTNVTVTNAYRDVRVKFVCDATNCPPSGVTACSSDSFAIRPDNLAVTATITSPLRAGNATLGDTFTLSALASGNGTTTTTYNGKPNVDPLLVTAVLSGPNIAGIVDGTFNASVGGTANGTFGYSEVGYFSINANGVVDGDPLRFTAVDPFPGDCTDDFNNTYVAANPSSTVGCKFGNAIASANIGRFTPANFVSLNNVVPVPAVPSVTPFCGSGVTGFTYEAQPALRLKFTLEAQNQAAVRTQNYDSSYANGNGLVDLLAENNNDNINLGSRLNHTSAPWPVWVLGQFIVDKTGSFSRLAAPDGAFDNLQIGARVTRASAADGDNDGIKVSPQDMAVAGKNGVLLPGTTRVRYGRGRIFNAYGSELLNLPVPFVAEYWNGGWTVNALDTCTGDTTLPLGAANTVSVTLAPPSAWAAGVACVMDSGNPGLSGAGCAAAAAAAQRYREGATPGVGFAGNFNLNLRTPGTGNTGAVTVTGNVPSWLQFPWAGAADINPTARATFGIYKGGNVFIDQRENY